MSAHDRRSFFSMMTSLAGLAAVPSLAEAAAVRAAGAPAGQAAPGATQKWDLTWLDRMKGQHKQVYDLGTHDLSVDPIPLRLVRNFVETFKEAYGLEPSQLSVVVGCARTYPMVAVDRVWEKYRMGERYKIIDPKTKQPAIRNVFLDDGPLSVKAIQALGAEFWQCNRALNTITQQLAEFTGLPPSDIRPELAAGLVPGVHLVPSHVLALALAQERGFTYVKS